MTKQNTAKRATRSFYSAGTKNQTLMLFRGDGAKYIGDYEPAYPDLATQEKWPRKEYEKHLSESFNWYALTQEDKHGRELALSALGLSGHFPELVKALKNSTIQLSTTSCWLIRMARIGLKLQFHEKRFIVREIRKCIENQKEVLETEKSSVAKPNIQEYISAKLKRIQGEIDLAFDQFINSGYRQSYRSVMNILADPETSAPGSRVKELAVHIDRYLTEYKLLQSGKNDQLNEAYSHLGKREIKAAIEWLEQAHTDISTFGQSKKATRKARKKKPVTPAKVISRLKYTKAFDALGLESIDPLSILKSSEIWVYNVNTRKLGRYISLPNSSFDVKGTRLLNLDMKKCVQKTLRKPKEQLKEFSNYSKSGALKWFEKIHAVATPLREALNADSVILKATK